ncbi:class I SAM-dependent methyltransferase [Micromonospora sp. NPDC006766]|uniref:class I SAM-dependent methyltransferase n=1 Tax=Micromonospora sp. NPDC006766 TaxID=3154778 RepID=UPI0033FD8B7B
MRDNAAASIVDRLMSDGPVFHASGTRVWNALPDTLRLLAANVSAGDRTLETGAGASTVIFTAAGSEHTAVSPAADEHQRIRDYCQTIGLDTSQLSFIADTSDAALPALALDRPVDVAFIDGKHSFPHPVIDFHFIEQRLSLGGVLVLDDIPMPAVAVVYGFMHGSPDWELIEVADHRAAAFRKLAAADPDDNWHLQPFNRGYPDYSFAPLSQRIRLTTHHRVRQGARKLRAQLPSGVRRAAPRQ